MKSIILIILLLISSIAQADPKPRKGRVFKRVAIAVAVGIVAIQLSTQDHQGIKRQSR